MKEVFKLRAADIYRVRRHRAGALGARAAWRTTSRRSRDAGTVDPAALGRARRLGWRWPATSTRWCARPCGRWPSCSATSTRCCSCSTRTAAACSRSPATATTRRAWGPRWPSARAHRHGRGARQPMRIGNLRQMDRYSHGPSVVRGRGRRRPRARDPGAWPARRPEPARGARPGAGPARRRAGGREHRAGGVHRGRRGRPHRGRVARRQRDRDRARPRPADVEAAAAPPATAPATPAGPATRVRFFEVDGSTFLDGDYLIKGVAGRILWALLGHYDREGRVDFTNREVRLDPRSTCRRSATTSRAG